MYAKRALFAAVLLEGPQPTAKRLVLLPGRRDVTPHLIGSVFPPRRPMMVYYYNRTRFTQTGKGNFPTLHPSSLKGICPQIKRSEVEESYLDRKRPADKRTQ